MTRHTATTRSSTARLTLEVRIERDETSSYRHQWHTTARLGLLTGRGANTRDAVSSLADQIAALAHSPGAETALVAEGAAAKAHYDAEVHVVGPELAAERMRQRLRGLDPDREALDPATVQGSP